MARREGMIVAGRRSPAGVVARADRLWTWLAAAWTRRPVAFLAWLTTIAFAVRLAATPFGPDVGLDVYAYALKAVEISRGDWTPVHSHAIGWSIVLAPFVWPVADGAMLTVLHVVRVVACAIGALAVVPFALIVCQALDRRSQVLALLFCPFALLLVRTSVRGFAEPLLTLALLGAVAAALRSSWRARTIGAVAAGLATAVHPTAIAIPFIVAAVAAMTAPARRRSAAFGCVLALALLVAAPAALHRASVFDGPFDYGFNSQFVTVPELAAARADRAGGSLRDQLAGVTLSGLVERVIVRGALSEAVWLVEDVVHPPVAVFLAIGTWRAVRSPHLRPVLVALALFLLSWVPVWAIYGNGRHLSPGLPFALIVVAAGVHTVARRRRHIGAWMLVIAIAYAAGEYTAAQVQRARVLGSEAADGLVWARWVVENARGRVAIASGQELVLMQLRDARIGGRDFYTIEAPVTGLALVLPVPFRSLDATPAWMRANAVSYLVVDGGAGERWRFRALLDAARLPDSLVERYASAPGSRWPVRILELRGTK